MAVQKTSFGGDRGELFLLALKTGALTLLTAGIYRFWAKTRLRRWYWSSVRPGNAPMEYTGTALEKLTGFLFALVLLAIVLTVANLVGIMATIDLLETLPIGLAAAVGVIPLAIFPLWFFARYRARRYILARTRWRAIRFGMEPGAWGYAWRACLYWILTVLSGGLLWPLKTFQLEKYLTDRTWFGTARFTQHGRFTRLYGPLLPFIISLWGGIAAFGYFGFANAENTLMTAGRYNEPWAAFVGIFALLLSFLFGLYFRIASIRIMTADKTLGDGIEFDIHPKTRRIVRIYFFGWWKTYLASGFVSAVVWGLMIAVFWLTGSFDPQSFQAPPVNLSIAMSALTYLMLMLLATTFRQTFIIFPMVQHFSETLEMHQPELLMSVRQRDRDGRTDAGGFAEALDAGAAF